MSEQVRAGTLAELQAEGRLLTKVGTVPVVVFWHEDAPYAIEDRCPHLGFPLHQGTVEAGLVTCHWHHARFDLVSGCTLDLWADDARGFSAAVRDGEVFVAPRADADPTGHLQARLRDGLEEGITLVVAKSVLGLLDAGVSPAEIVRTGVDFGTTYRGAGWGAGLTVLVAMANLFPHLDADDRALALVHGLAFVSNDTSNQAPRFPVGPLPTQAVPIERLGAWYRRFVDTRSGDAAERVLATALAAVDPSTDVEPMMFAAVTDHVFIDGGHTLDFTNKAFEAIALVGSDAAVDILPTLVQGTARAQRSEEFSEWQHPHNLVTLATETVARIEAATATPTSGAQVDVGAVAWQLLADEPVAVADALVDARKSGATDEELGRAIAYAAALRIVRFHTRNDHADWDTVHHSFTAASALHQALRRNPTPELRRGAVQAALRIYLDRFLNVPAARLPHATTGSIEALNRCFDTQGLIDDAANEAYGFLAAGGSRAELIAALGRALLVEDAGFHWFQTVEAGVRQAMAWPEGSEESALVLVGVARFLAAHTPTRRELPTVIRIAARLRRGEALYEDDDADAEAATLAALAVAGQRREERGELHANDLGPHDVTIVLGGRDREALLRAHDAGEDVAVLAPEMGRGLREARALGDELVQERAGCFRLHDVSRPHLVDPAQRLANVHDPVDAIRVRRGECQFETAECRLQARPTQPNVVERGNHLRVGSRTDRAVEVAVTSHAVPPQDSPATVRENSARA